MAHITAVMNGKWPFVFKIVLRRLLLAPSQLRRARQALDARQPSLREATALPVWGANSCNEMLMSTPAAVTAFQHLRQNRDTVREWVSLFHRLETKCTRFVHPWLQRNLARRMLSGLEEREQMINLKVNGVDRSFDGDPAMPLLWYLRDILGLTGTKFGCGVSLCGACTVHKNGEAIRSCVTPMSAAAGSEVRTIEDLGAHGLHPVQEAWMRVNVPQCGYCQSGQIMQAVSLLKASPHPTDQEIDDAMAGNICRCGTYQRLRQAIKLAAEKIA